MLLSGDDTVWAYGRTIIPHTLFRGKYTRLYSELNNKPIGDLLFSQPGSVRQQLEIACLTPNCAEFQFAIRYYPHSAKELWARRAKFYVFDSVLSVSEVLFPEIAAYVEN